MRCKMEIFKHVFAMRSPYIGSAFKLYGNNLYFLYYPNVQISISNYIIQPTIFYHKLTKFFVLFFCFVLTKYTLGNSDRPSSKQLLTFSLLFKKHAGSLRSNMTISSSQHAVKLKTLKNRLRLPPQSDLYCYLKKPKQIFLFMYEYFSWKRQIF